MLRYGDAFGGEQPVDERLVTCDRQCDRIVQRGDVLADQETPLAERDAKQGSAHDRDLGAGRVGGAAPDLFVESGALTRQRNGGGAPPVRRLATLW